MEKHLSVKEVADILGLSTKTIYRFIFNRDLMARKLGRIYRIGEKEIDRFLAKHRIEAKNSL